MILHYFYSVQVRSNKLVFRHPIRFTLSKEVLYDHGRETSGLFKPDRAALLYFQQVPG